MSTILVACKIPNGFILRLHEPKEEYEPVFGGGSRKVTVFVPTGEEIQIEGSGHPLVANPEADVRGGYALTPVDSGFWEKWSAQNKDAEVLRKGLLFAHEKSDHIKGQVKEQNQAKVVSGLEPIDPNNLPVGVTVNKKYKLKLTTADEQSKSAAPAAPAQASRGKVS